MNLNYLQREEYEKAFARLWYLVKEKLTNSDTDRSENKGLLEWISDLENNADKDIVLKILLLIWLLWASISAWLRVHRHIKYNKKLV